MSTFTDEIFGTVCYTVSSKHNPREGVFCYETRENLEIHVLFRGVGAGFVRCASRAHRCRAARRVQKAAALQPVQNRGGRGVITYKITPKTGNIVGIRMAKEDDDVMLITNSGTIIRINVKDVSILGRATQGVTLMRTNENEKVVSIETVEPEE